MGSWGAVLWLSAGSWSAPAPPRNHPLSPRFLTATAQTQQDLQDLEQYYQEAQAQLETPDLPRPKQHRLVLEQAAYLRKMRGLASFQPFAVSRKIAAFLLAHETDETDPLKIRERW